MATHPLQSLVVSTEMLNDLKGDFESEINSRRLKSKITSISDLIYVLHKRNVINRTNYNIILQNVLDRFSSVSDKTTIEDFVYSLDRDNDHNNTSANQYGEPKFMPLNNKN